MGQHLDGTQPMMGRFRAWWSRHPQVTDLLVTGMYFVLAALLVTQAGIIETIDDPAGIPLALAVLLVSTLAVLFRRRWTTAMSTVVLAVAAVSMFRGASADVFAIPIMLFSLAVHRSIRRAILFCFLFIGVAFLVPLLPWAPPGAAEDEIDTVLLILSAIIGLLVGIATRSRRDYVRALMDQAAQREQLATANERTRIAREMHDIVSHTLTVIVTLADGAASSRDHDTARTAIKGAADASRSALSELRGLLGALRNEESAPLTPQPTATDLPLLAEQLIRAGLPVTLTITGEMEDNAAVSFAIYRAVQEGLTNALRYSTRATRADVLITHTAEGVDIIVENDNAQPHARSVGTGQGLLGLRERIDLLGGNMDSRLAAPGVWKLHVWIPLGATIGEAHDD